MGMFQSDIYPDGRNLRQGSVSIRGTPKRRVTSRIASVDRFRRRQVNPIDRAKLCFVEHVALVTDAKRCGRRDIDTQTGRRW